MQKRSIHKIKAKLSAAIKQSLDNENFHELQVAVIMKMNKDIKSAIREIKVVFLVKSLEIIKQLSKIMRI